jgi:hypothetical protein
VVIHRKYLNHAGWPSEQLVCQARIGSRSSPQKVAAFNMDEVLQKESAAGSKQPRRFDSFLDTIGEAIDRSMLIWVRRLLGDPFCGCAVSMLL